MKIDKRGKAAKKNLFSNTLKKRQKEAKNCLQEKNIVPEYKTLTIASVNNIEPTDRNQKSNREKSNLSLNKF